MCGALSNLSKSGAPAALLPPQRSDWSPDPPRHGHTSPLTLRRRCRAVGGAVAGGGRAAVGGCPILVLTHHIRNFALKIAPQLLQCACAVAVRCRAGGGGHSARCVLLSQQCAGLCLK